MFGHVTPCVLVKGQWSVSVMVAQRESSVPRTLKVQSDNVTLVEFSFRAIESCVELESS